MLRVSSPWLVRDAGCDAVRVVVRFMSAPRPFRSDLPMRQGTAAPATDGSGDEMCDSRVRRAHAPCLRDTPTSRCGALRARARFILVGDVNLGACDLITTIAAPERAIPQ